MKSRNILPFIPFLAEGAERAAGREAQEGKCTGCDSVIFSRSTLSSGSGG